MRVIAGAARRLKLVAPEGNETRPTQDAVKETLFNMLRNDVPGAVVIDLFAGSGAIGIEALSRGAKQAFFVENQSAAIRCLLQNLKTTRFEDGAVVLRADALSAIDRIRVEEADIIYMDPPYEAGLYAPVLERLSRASYVSPYTIVIAESDANRDFSFAEKLGFDVTKEKRYKNSKHVFLARREAI